MIQVFAPYPTVSVMMYLPSAEWGDTERLESTVQLKRSMNNSTKVTHVSVRENSRTLEFQFLLTRYKSLELIEFFKIHGADKVKLVIRGQAPRIGYLKINPLELEKMKRSLVSDSLEEVSCTVTFETIE